MIASDDERKLFVSGLSEGTNEASLRQVFTDAGVDVEHVSIPRDRMTGRLRGFAFITLRDVAQVETAVSEIDGLLVGESNLSVRRFNAERPQRAAGPGGAPRNQDNSDRTLFVGNLPYDATQEELEGLMRDTGVESVVRIFMPLDAEGRRRGFGFVTMGSPEAATNAVQRLQGAALRGRSLVVNAAQPRAPGPRPERSFAGPGGGGGGGFSSPSGPGMGGPSGPPGANRFGPPAKPTGKNDYSKKRKVEGLANGGRGGRGAKRSNEERWRDYDD